MNDDEDVLNAARGIAFGALGGIVFWLLVLAIAIYAYTHGRD